MPVDQAVFTSLQRKGRSGYHLVARSPGVTDAEAAALAKWCPSHGALTVDDANPVSVNFHPLPTGRYVLSRTCRGRPEYSGRGGRQVYTHALLVNHGDLKRAGFRPFAVYRDALALGHLHYRPEPPPTLPQLQLSGFHTPRDESVWPAVARSIGVAEADGLLAQLRARQEVVLAHDGDRAALAEALTDQLEPEALLEVSFTTNLLPSSVRPFLLTLVAPGPTTGGR